MFRKIFLLFIIFIFGISCFNITLAQDPDFIGPPMPPNMENQLNQENNSGGCTYEEGMSLGGLLSACKPSKVAGSGDYDIEGGFKEAVNNWIVNISLILGVLAVGAIVYSALLLQISGGEDEKIKKAKDIFKWSILGFLGLISASGIIYLVINLIYGLA